MRTYLTLSRVSLAAMTIIVPFHLTASQAPEAVSQPSACEQPAWGSALTTFDTRVQAYVALRERIKAALPSIQPTADGNAAATRRHALANKIRAARSAARQGDLFTTAIGVEIRKSLRLELDAHTWKVIMDDNPGEIPSQVNAEYRDGQPLSTMPPNILAALPRLPADLEYRFVERHLILLDSAARLIVDRIPYAISPSDVGNTCR